MFKGHMEFFVHTFRRPLKVSVSKFLDKQNCQLLNICHIEYWSPRWLIGRKATVQIPVHTFRSSRNMKYFSSVKQISQQIKNLSFEVAFKL